jgi:hypothetical protein
VDVSLTDREQLRPVTSEHVNEQPQWMATGEYVKYTGQVDRIPEFNPRSGDHLWTWAVMYRASPEAETPMLDTENLLLITGPGCFYCEQVYSKRLAMRRCSGHPQGS